MRPRRRPAPAEVLSGVDPSGEVHGGGLPRRAHDESPEHAEFEAMRDRLIKSESPRALIEIAVLVAVLSGINFLLRPEYQPTFHLLDLGAAAVMVVIGLWMRRDRVPASMAPWTFALGIVVLALALLIQVWVEPSGGPGYLLILLGILGPVTLAWAPFLTGAALITAGTAVATYGYPNGAVVDWTFLAITAAIASSVLLQLRLRSIRSEVHARHVLSEENQRLELVLDSSRLGLWDWDMRTDTLVCDERWAEILGFQLHDLAPLSIDTEDRLIHPDDRPASDGLFEEHVKGRVPFFDVELRMRHRDGHWVWVHDRGRIVEWSADGAPLRMTGTLEDVSDAHTAAERLAAAEEESRLAMDNASIGMCLISNDGRFLRANPAMGRMLGLPADALLTMSLDEVTHPDDSAILAETRRALAGGMRTTGRHTLRFVTAGGHVIWGDASLSPVHNDDGSVRHLVAQVVDVTNEHALRQSLLEAQRIAHVGSWQLDLVTGELAWSDELLLMFGLDAWDPKPTRESAEQYFEPTSWALLQSTLASMVKSGLPCEIELEVLRADGTHGWVLGRGEGVRDATGAVVSLQGVAMDITHRKLATDELLRMATHDPLTGLANRVALNDQIELALRAGRRTGRATAVLMIDLDRFKDVNDTLGHAAGDRLLVAAADRVTRIVRAGDLVARTGGDEFVIVMRDLEDPEEALQAARRIVEVFREPFTTQESELYATASVGVATSSDSGDAGDLVREADTAMYVAKETGRDRVAVFNEGLRAVATARIQIEGDLRRAFDNGQLSLWYQPEIDLTTGTMTAVEALLRWQHPDGSIWTADRFVDIAEKTGLILDIGDWALREACTQAACWGAARPDPPLTVRVNVSTLQLAESGLLSAIDEALASSQLDPSLLCLEITETTLLHQTAAAAGNLTGIRERGISIAIDDFGTGYASLAYLRDYPIDILKIDRSFVTYMGTNDNDARIVAGIIALARALDIDVTAEGVETVEHAALLRAMGCPTAQGYLFSRALPPEQITDRLWHTYARQ